jgi:galactose-1-phosphate uridylyltransferase
LSGGTILHPHMQIVGLRHVDSSLMYDKSDFIGMTISQTKNVELNVSTMPRLGFCELNILTKNNNELDTIADFIQITVDYIMKYFNKRCKSYNIFFYRIDGLIAVKVMPRFPTSPLFIGYNLRLRPNNLNIIVDEMQKLYFNKS